MKFLVKFTVSKTTTMESQEFSITRIIEKYKKVQFLLT